MIYEFVFANLSIHSTIRLTLKMIFKFWDSINDSPWANGGPYAPPHPALHTQPPWSSMTGTILFRGPSGIILAM